ncbi:MAG: sugar transporter substrate-binding protein, partial [Clostridia bacterium]|nr:sugar transporter substrate-binding protein [Clostridia bacterium]
LKLSGAVSPFEMLEKKEWTFDNFKNWLPTIATLTADKNIYALSAPYDIFTTAAIYANGGNKYIKDESGIYSFGYTQPEAIDAINWSASIFNMKDYVDAQGKAQFEESETVITCAGSYTATENYRPEQILNVIEDITWLYFPYGPKGEYGKSYGSYLPYETFTGITLTGDEQDTAFVFDKITEPLTEFGEDGYLFGHTKRNLFHHVEEGFDVWYDNYINCNYDILSVIYSEINSGSVNNKINTALSNAARGSKSAAEAIEAIAESVQTDINKAVNDIN